jgi:cell division protein FtsL
MTRLGTVFWVVVVLAAGFTTFKVKYAVQDIEDELNRARRQTIAEQQETRVLTAEWTYLNQPERLAELNRRFLGLAAVSAKQLQHSIAEIPLRAPAAPPDALVAASPDPVAPQAAATPLPVAAVAVVPASAIEGTTRQATSTNPPDEVSAGEGARLPATAAPVQLTKAGSAQAANSLDALIAQIAEAR